MIHLKEGIEIVMHHWIALKVAEMKFVSTAVQTRHFNLCSVTAATQIGFVGFNV